MLRHFNALLLAMTVFGGSNKCDHPTGEDGSSHTEGCIRLTCKKGVWRTSLDSSVCCYDGAPYTPGDTVITTVQGCSQATLVCQDHPHNRPTLALQVENKCGKYATKEHVKQLKEMVEDYTETKGCQQKNTTSETTTIPAPDTKQGGILVSGGWGAQRSVELFIPGVNRTCILPDLPDNRNGHTMDSYTFHDEEDVVSVCGGGAGDTQGSCVCFKDWGEWEDCSKETGALRDGHSSWVSSEGLVLMGGVGSLRSTSESFSLIADTRYACSITDSNSVIITGGRDTMKKVIRYNLQGFVEYLPSMDVGRRYHGCGSYQDSVGDKVLLVTGGKGGYSSYSSHILASTELLTIGATAWVYAEPLPRAMIAMATVSMDNKVFVTGGGRGGRDDGHSRRSEVLAFDGENWEEVGHLSLARNFHAATTAYVDYDHDHVGVFGKCYFS